MFDTKDGKTFLDILISRGHESVVKVLDKEGHQSKVTSAASIAYIVIISMVIIG